MHNFIAVIVDYVTKYDCCQGHVKISFCRSNDIVEVAQHKDVHPGTNTHTEQEELIRT